MAVVLNHSKASGAARLILLGIANHEGDGGAFPSKERLGRYANIDEGNVRRHLRSLEDLGELSTEVNGGQVRDQAGKLLPRALQPNLYRVILTCPPDCDGSPQHRISAKPQVECEGVDLTPGPEGGVILTLGALVTPGEGSNQPPKPSLEPSLKPLSASADEMTIPGTEDPASFEAFVNAYAPRGHMRRSGAKTVRTAWAKAVTKAPAALIVQQATRYRAVRQIEEDRGSQPQYQKQADVWLNQEQWLTDYPAPETTPSRPPSTEDFWSKR